MSIITQPRYSCALAAQQTVLAIPGAHPIVHAGPGCSSKMHGFASMHAGYQGEGYAGGSTVSSTNTGEKEVVFGGEKKLSSTIEGALKVLKGDLFVVMTGCTADIVGDDSVSIAKEFAERGLPIVGVETAGFKGNSYYGHGQVVNAIIEQFTGDAEPKPRKGLVNLFSVVPNQDPFWRADLEGLKALLESIGLTVNVLYGYGSAGVSEWKDIPNAQFNLLVSSWVGLDTVKLLEEKYGTPYFHYPVFPVGAQETSRFLRETGKFAGIESETVEQVIAKEEKRYYKYFISFVDFLTEFRNHLPNELYTVADSTYAPGLTSFLVNEVGFIPKGVYLIDNAPESFRSGIVKPVAERDESTAGLITFQIDGELIHNDIKQKLGNSHKALFLGSGWEKFLAENTKNLYAFVSLPLLETVILNRSYIGYNGGLNLIEEIYSNLFKTRKTSLRTQINFE